MTCIEHAVSPGKFFDHFVLFLSETYWHWTIFHKHYSYFLLISFSLDGCIFCNLYLVLLHTIQLTMIPVTCLRSFLWEIYQVCPKCLYLYQNHMYFEWNQFWSLIDEFLHHTIFLAICNIPFIANDTCLIFLILHLICSWLYDVIFH